MLKKLLFIIFLFFALQNSIFPQSLNMTLMSHFNDSNLKPCDNGQVWNDLTGYFDSIKKREYLIGGSCDSIYFFDVTNPSVMKKCDVREGHSRGSINRDYECYSHYAYCVSDRSTQSGSLQIFDLQYLPDSVHKVYDNDSLSINSHTIFIETKSQRLYLAGNNRTSGVSSSMLILSIANPEAPFKIGELPTSAECVYTHEVYVRNDTAYCSCAYQGLFFYDVRNPLSPSKIGDITTYPLNGYNHSSWLDSTGKYIMFSDEVPFGLSIKIYDISDIKNAKLVSLFNSNTGATPHNAYWKGRYAIVSSYEDGVYAYDLIDPSNPKVAGYYDTYPKNPAGTYNGYWRGCWGVYCFLPSGNILASDETEGFFVIQPTSTFGIQNQSEENNSFYVSIYPNPINEILNLKIYSAQKKSALLKVVDIIGNTILQKNIELRSGENIFSFDELKNHSPGMYFVQISSETISKNIKLLKH